VPEPEPEVSHAKPVLYTGGSRFLRYWPPAMLVVAAGAVVAGSVAAGAVLASPGVLAALFLPWGFVIDDDGIGLRYGLGKRRFLTKDSVTVDVAHGTIVLHRSGTRGFGVPLTDGAGDERRPYVQAVLAEHGFALTR